MMKSIGGKIACAVVMVGLTASGSFAGVQLKPTKSLLVKNPSGLAASRTIVWSVSEKASSNTLVGDPTVNGATLNIQLSPGGIQCVQLPAIDWDRIGTDRTGTIGFKYNDASLDHGPVRSALIKKLPSGTFQIRVQLKGSGISVVPGNPTGAYAVNLNVVAGDEYCSGSGSATPKPNDAKTFKVVNDTAPATCGIPACL